MDPSSFGNTSIRCLEAFEREIDALLPSEKIRGKANPELQAALAKYAQVVWDVATRLPHLEDAGALVASAQALAPHPVFVVGVHRSGTTLMHHILDGHPALAVLPSEGTYLTNVYPRLRRMDEAAGIAYLVQRWIPRLINPDNQPPYWTMGRTHEDSAPYLTVARNALTLAAHAPALFTAYAPFRPHLILVMAVQGARHPGWSDESASYWVDKTPLNEFHASALHAAFPDARFIHMVRDPRAIFASRKQVQLDVTGTPGSRARFLYTIARSFRLARRNRARFGPAAYHVVRYEGLLDDLAGEREAVRTFLGIADHPALRQATSSGMPCAANSSYRLPFAAGQVQAHAALSYRNVLTPLERWLVKRVTGRQARKMGYTV